MQQRSFKNRMFEIISRGMARKGIIIRSYNTHSHYLSKVNIFSSRDSVRLETLGLIAQCIYENNVQGAVAEFGVYRGSFAKHINEAFPERSFYLFDTFEGFDARDIESEKQKGLVNANEDFTNTSIAAVMEKMPYPGKCVIKKGFFPDTASDVEDEFAFVCIDADLYDPIYAGLEYFFPKLSRGGYLMVHDFDNTKYPGARRAVQHFCKEQNVVFVPLCDNCGSAVIGRPL